METLPLLFLFVFGAIAGSFAYAMTLRMYDGRDWVRGRSECDHCHKVLLWHDLIPLVSWLRTGGKCRRCHKKLGVTYPLVELGTAMAFAVSFVVWPYDFTRTGIAIFAVWLVMVTLMVSLIIFDLRWYLLPDRLVYSLVALAGASKLAQLFYFDDFSRLTGIVGGVAVGSGIFYALYAFSKGKYIGGGDVKYGLFFGILLADPFKSLLVISLGSIIGTLLILPGLLQKKTKMNSQIPFGPSLILATGVVYLFGDRIVDILTGVYLFP